MEIESDRGCGRETEMDGQGVRETQLEIVRDSMSAHQLIKLQLNILIANSEFTLPPFLSPPPNNRLPFPFIRSLVAGIKAQNAWRPNEERASLKRARSVGLLPKDVQQRLFNAIAKKQTFFSEILKLG